MARKKKNVSLGVFWEVVLYPAWFWAFTLIPGLVAAYGTYGGDIKTLISIIPLWALALITLISFVVTLVVSATRYAEKAKLAQLTQKPMRAKRNKTVSAKSQAGDNGQAVAIGQNHGPINIYGSGSEKQNKQANESSPVIIPDKTGFDKLESAFPLWSNSVASTTKVKRYHLVLRNTGNVDTTPIHAALSFYDMNCVELTQFSHEKAFWFNDKPRAERTGTEIHVIKARSSPEGITLVIQKQGEEDLYVFSDDSYFPGTKNIVFNESLKIPLAEIYVRVELNANNLTTKVIWVKITNQGSNYPNFEVLDKSPL